MNGIGVKTRNCKRNAAVAETALLGFSSFASQSVMVTKCRFALSGSFWLREHMVVPL